MAWSIRVKAGFLAATLIVPSLLFIPLAAADTDTTNPVITSISPDTGTTLGPGVVQFVIEAYDEHPGQLTLTFGDEDVVVPAPSYDGPGTAEPSNMNATLTTDTNNLPDGGYILHVKAKDAAGNITERSARYVIDKQAPSVPASGAPHDSVRADTVQFDWPASQDVTSPGGLRYDFRASQDDVDVGTAPENSNALWRRGLTTNVVTVDSLAGGIWYWQVRAIDAAGNKSEWSQVWNVLIDTAAPTLDVRAPAMFQLFGGINTTIHVDSDVFDANGLSEYGILLDGIEAHKEVLPTNGSMVPVSMSMDLAADGEHAVTVYASDMAGNRAEVTRTVILDTTGPEIATMITDNEVVKGLAQLDMTSADLHPGSHTISVRSEDGTIVEQGVPDANQDGLWQYQWDTTAVEDGTYIVTFQSVDAAGNTSVLEKTIRVKNNVMAGMGTALPSVPLVSPLEVELLQPRLIGIVTPPIEGEAHAGDIVAGDVIKTSDGAAPLLDTVPIQPTESGWRLFGILWYWWTLAMGAVGTAAWWGWRFVQRRAPVDLP